MQKIAGEKKAEILNAVHQSTVLTLDKMGRSRENCQYLTGYELLQSLRDQTRLFDKSIFFVAGGTQQRYFKNTIRRGKIGFQASLIAEEFGVNQGCTLLCNIFEYFLLKAWHTIGTPNFQNLKRRRFGRLLNRCI